ncbi:transcriptional regulator PtsJ [Stenotrophomonas sp.]|uniref:MocR-like B6 salvage transcription factor PtsJ n=1 Tax=Stenotrophomonas sp. TaxID=69392 RepID=UPI0028990F99|nr:transcriptional regulator PtsJ [Stenotrophomonas sp.]
MEIVGNSAAAIFESIRGLVQAGHLRAGQELPTVRDLAASLGVNRNTVSSAYKRLVSAGVATTQGRLGTTIRDPMRLGEAEGSRPGCRLMDLAGGNPDPEWLPDIVQVLAQRPQPAALYGAPAVHPELEALAIAWMQGDCPPAFQIDIAGGAVDAVERLLACHLVPGDKVAVENPCFVSSVNTLRVAGLQPAPVGMDGKGMIPAELEAALAQGAQAVILTPRAQNPTGCALGARRAAEIRGVLSRHPNALVIVDDHFAMLATDRYFNVIPANARRWALVRSVSKALGPDLRLAVVASDDHTSSALRLRLTAGTHWVSHLLQQAVIGCLTSPAINARIEGARDRYAERRSLLRRLLQERGIATAASTDGLNVWMPMETDSQPLVLELARHGWLTRGGASFGVPSPCHGVRLTISSLAADDAVRFADDLAAAMKRLAL